MINYSLIFFDVFLFFGSISGKDFILSLSSCDFNCAYSTFCTLFFFIYSLKSFSNCFILNNNFSLCSVF